MAATRSGAVVKLIPLARGKWNPDGTLCAMVDDEDYEELIQYKWRVRRDGKNFYAQRRGPNGIPILMHRQIAGYAMTDHADGNGLNNQRENLRETTKQLNALNKLKEPGGSSQYKGVACVGTRKWRVMCSRHPVIDADRWGISPQICIGTFMTEEKAGLAYDEAIRLRFGREGTRNFPLPGERSALTGEVMPQWTESRSTAWKC